MDDLDLEAEFGAPLPSAPQKADLSVPAPPSAPVAPAPPEAVPDLFEGLSPSPDAKRASRDDASALAVRATRAEHEAAKLRDEVERLRARADEASRAERTAREERDVLLENISKLYATARDEIVRKDEELKRLRDRVASLEASLGSQQHARQGPHRQPSRPAPRHPEPPPGASARGGREEPPGWERGRAADGEQPARMESTRPAPPVDPRWHRADRSAAAGEPTGRGPGAPRDEGREQRDARAPREGSWGRGDPADRHRDWEGGQRRYDDRGGREQWGRAGYR